ncbi:hypothetical protein B9J78_06240 [bacterium Unc6]|nr:hypothetical protein [bacterium Unc6]MBT9129959.1 (R)-phenyllactyl-CoA dehydratase beta subunit [Candidatus Psychracetigena formicireducens]
MNFFKRIKKAGRDFEIKKLAQKEFERRYSYPVLKKENWQVKEKLKEATSKNLELIRKAPHRPEGISYYEDIISGDKREKELQKFSGKIIGSFCIFTPEELIHSACAIPVRLCAGAYDTISIAEEVLPRDICPLVKSSFGFKVARFSYFELCDAVISPTPCDDKKKLGEILSNYLPVWSLRLPQSKEIGHSQEYWLREIRILKERIEQLTCNKITKKSLKESIRILHKRQEVLRRFYELRKNNPPLINGRDALLVIQTGFYDDINRWIEKTQKLCDELEERKSNNKLPLSNCRLLLTGAPIIWPNYKLLNIIEEMQSTIVIDELCSGTRHFYDPVEVNEWTMDGMLQAIANRYLLPSSCPCFTESDDRIDKILQSAEDFKVNGVIHHSLRLCPLYDMELPKVSRVFKDKGIPFLAIHTDYSLEDIEQIRTRVEAFLEMLRSRT